MSNEQSSDQTERNDWRAIVSRYQRSDTGRAIAQIVTTLVPLAVVFYVMYRSLVLPYWTTSLLALPAAGLLVHTFIIMHDCSHGSFLPWKRANSIVGWITGVLTLTPFVQWRHDHALHHASSGDLNRRGHGDVPTLTVREYAALSRGARLRYRLLRNPLVLFGLVPIHFVLTNRIPPRGADATTKRGRVSVWSANFGIVALFVAASLWIGWSAVLLVYGPAMRGSSYLRLPAVLRWFTGGIGLHHVHHLGPRIPNYALVRCHEENPLFQDVTVITLAQSVRTLRLTLWDEARQQLVGFRDVVVPRPLPSA